MDQLISTIHRMTLSRHYKKDKENKWLVHFSCWRIWQRGAAPHSDIDLLFLYQKDQLIKHQPVIEYILYLLWDLGLKVGHATRTSDQCLEAANDDITIMTALLEIRYIKGDEKLFENFEKRLRSWISEKPVSYFVTEKLRERDSRHKQHGATRYMVEPQIKEGKGGLRDLHTLFWIAKFAYKVRSVEEVIELGVLRVSEAKNFAASQRFLWTVRFLTFKI